MKEMELGPYAQIGKGIPDIIQWLREMGANTAQIYNGNPRSLRLKTKHTWTDDEVKALREANIPLWFHAGHLVHLAAHPIESRARVLADLEDNVKIGGSGVVVHTGFGQDIKKLIDQLKWLDKHAPKKARIIVEVPSGQNNHLGFPYEEYAQLMARLPKRRFWVGLDTAHLFAGGVDLRQPHSLQNWLQQMAKAAGQTQSAFEKRVALLHLNDVGVELDARRDYHAPLGRGYWLGKHLGGNPKAIFEVLRWAKKKKVAVILETKGDYAREVEWIRKAEANGFKETMPLLKQKNRKNHKHQQNGGANRDETLTERVKMILDDMRAYRTMTGEPFRARAYDRLLRLLDRNETPFNREHLEYWKGRPGVGKGLGEKLEEIIRRGTFDEYEEIRKKPELKAWKAFMAIPGVGPSVAQKFVREGNRTIQDIQKRAVLTAKQRFGVEHYADLQKKVPLIEARWWHKKIESVLKGKDIGRGDVRVELMGGFRTGKKSGHDIDFVLTMPNQERKNKEGLQGVVREIIARGKKSGWVVEGEETWLERGWSGYVRKPGGIVRAMDIRWAPYREFPFWTLYFGSGVVWNQYLRQRAKEMGFQLNQKGLFYRGTNRRVPEIQSEKDVFQKLEVPWVPPHQRSLTPPGEGV